MKASLAFCILAALLAVGACLQCEVCSGPGNDCTGSLQTCTLGEDTCGVALTESTFGGEKMQNIIKRCLTSSLCKDGPMSMSFGTGMTTRTIFACCVGEACRTVNVTVPPADTKPNGRHCLGCYALFSQCSGEITECTGDETQCFQMAESITYGENREQIVMKGCASESFCAQTKVGQWTFGGVTTNLTLVKCTSGEGGVSSG
ncbi:phospholipase A2 inhibitor and Ly6/PLAUR domain-containing protein-like [Emydura macquarii macquarii]|uniref:phospholipase A2 inhibitor and Ly6/PLAUR domain-containing protein-like n=1 Tax=Emydura macquarii macquarii TaxID=1129001 RepID=UPI00352B9111